MTRLLLIVTIGIALAPAVARAQATDLPNANLPGNSATLPNSNLPGPMPTDNPITLPNTDTSRDAQEERAKYAEWQDRLQRNDEWQQETLQLAAKAVEEAARARAEAAEARQTLQDMLEQQQP